MNRTMNLTDINEGKKHLNLTIWRDLAGKPSAEPSLTHLKLHPGPPWPGPRSPVLQAVTIEAGDLRCQVGGGAEVHVDALARPVEAQGGFLGDKM